MTKRTTINDTKARLWGIPLLSLAIPLIFFHEECVSSPATFLREVSFTFCFTVFLWEGNRRVFSFVNNKFPLYEQTRKRIIWLAIGFLSYTIVGYSVIKFILLTLVFNIDFNWPQYFRGLRVSVIASALVTIIYETAHLFMLWKQSVMETESLKKAGIQAELEALKEQVNPHFMFNSLNTLAGLIPEDPVRAVTFVERLADTYRYVLNMQKKELVSLEDELKFLNAFTYVLKTRFGDKLQVNIDIEEELKKHYVPPVILQILLENAVKHNIVSKEKPLTVNISSTRTGNGVEITVSNPLQLKEKKEESSGLGLSNITKRYELLNRPLPKITVTDTSFEVSVTLITVKNYESH